MLTLTEKLQRHFAEDKSVEIVYKHENQVHAFFMFEYGECFLPDHIRVCKDYSTNIWKVEVLGPDGYSHLCDIVI